jgi:hypothetical protein
MAINVDRELDVIKSFKRRKILVNILQYVAIAGAAFAVFALTHRDPTLTGMPYTTEVIIGVIVFATGLVAFYLTWKCPSCKKFLGLKLNREKCINCGVELVHILPESEKPEKEDRDYYLKLRKTNTKKYNLFLLLVVALNVAFMLLLLNSSINTAFSFFLLFTLFLPIIILNYKYQKCPKCDHHFGKYMPRKCPECDTVLKEPGWFF